MNRHSLAAGVVLLFVAAFPSLMFAQERGNPGGQPAEACTVLSTGGVADGPARTFESIADRAKVIVEASVLSVNPNPTPAAAQPARPGVPLNDVLLLPVRVIKGPETLQQFAVGQLRASGLFEMRQGQRFILFLNDPSPQDSLRDSRPGVPRYALVPPATLCIDAGKVRVNSGGNFMRARFDGVELEKAVADIRAHLNSK